MSPPTHALEARGLVKRFGELTAVDRVSFTVGWGEVFGFFGPNGAGKTTTLRMLCGHTAPTEGTAVVSGLDIRGDCTALRRNLAIQQDDTKYYEYMTPEDYLRFFAEMAGYRKQQLSERVEWAVEFGDLGELRDRAITTLSHGQRRRVGMARTMLAEAPVVFLDEPFQGIDVDHRRDLRRRVREYVARGNTVFFTSHDLIEAEQIVDRFAFIDHGKMVEMGTATELRARYMSPTYLLHVADPERAEAVLRSELRVESASIVRGELEVTLVDASEVERIAIVLVAAGIGLSGLVHRGTMEDIFFRARGVEG